MDTQSVIVIVLMGLVLVVLRVTRAKSLAAGLSARQRARWMAGGFAIIFAIAAIAAAVAWTQILKLNAT